MKPNSEAKNASKSKRRCPTAAAEQSRMSK